jgi:hypothetical protein
MIEDDDFPEFDEDIDRAIERQQFMDRCAIAAMPIYAGMSAGDIADKAYYLASQMLRVRDEYE